MNTTTTPIQLPLHHATHRQITNAAGHVVIEIQSGGCANLEEANALQNLVVTACNTHGALLEHFNASLAMVNTMGHPEASAQIERDTETRFDASIVATRKALNAQAAFANPTGPTIAELQDAGALAKPDEHLQARLEAVPARGDGYCLMSADPRRIRVASPDSEGDGPIYSRANARRLAACWNLLRGFSTEQIEGSEVDLVALAAERDAAVTQADDLLATTAHQTQQLAAARALQAQLANLLKQCLTDEFGVTSKALISDIEEALTTAGAA